MSDSQTSIAWDCLRSEELRVVYAFSNNDKSIARSTTKAKTTDCEDQKRGASQIWQTEWLFFAKGIFKSSHFELLFCHWPWKSRFSWIISSVKSKAVSSPCLIIVKIPWKINPFPTSELAQFNKLCVKQHQLRRTVCVFILPTCGNHHVTIWPTISKNKTRPFCNRTPGIFLRTLSNPPLVNWRIWRKQKRNIC